MTELGLDLLITARGNELGLRAAVDALIAAAATPEARALADHRVLARRMGALFARGLDPWSAARAALVSGRHDSPIPAMRALLCQHVDAAAARVLARPALPLPTALPQELRADTADEVVAAFRTTVVGWLRKAFTWEVCPRPHSPLGRSPHIVQHDGTCLACGKAVPPSDGTQHLTLALATRRFTEVVTDAGTDTLTLTADQMRSWVRRWLNDWLGVAPDGAWPHVRCRA
jgi:hypothetical protein